jgi:hypothetical protein
LSVAESFLGKIFITVLFIAFCIIFNYFEKIADFYISPTLFPTVSPIHFHCVAQEKPRHFDGVRGKVRVDFNFSM